jgi:hypothetical protein
MDKRDEEVKRVAEAQRTTKAEARRRGIGTPEPGTDLPARSYTDGSGVADLGVDEPALPAAPESEGRAPRPGPDPIGMFAGESEEDRREADPVRRVLEAGFPETRGERNQGAGCRAPDPPSPFTPATGRPPPAPRR